MKTDAAPINVSDWINSDSLGIWQVYRVIQGMQTPRANLQERHRIDRRQLVFSKRIVDGSWQPAFSNELASAELVRVLSSDDRRRLDEYVEKNPQTLQEFEGFQPKPIDLRMNLRLNIPSLAGTESVQRLIIDVFAGIGDGLTNDAILQRMAASELARYDATMTISNATLQFTCIDHEHQNKDYVFRKVQLLMV